jgi:hypothetical protein
VIEIDRTVNATGMVNLAGGQVSVGFQLAGQRVTQRVEGSLMAVIGSGGVLLRTIACPIAAAGRYRLRGARRGALNPPTVQRRVSGRGGIMVATQKIQVGMIHAGKTVTVLAEDNSFRLVIDGETVAVVPRTTSQEIRYKAYAAHQRPRDNPTPERR